MNVVVDRKHDGNKNWTDAELDLRSLEDDIVNNYNEQIHMANATAFIQNMFSYSNHVILYVRYLWDSKGEESHEM